MDFELYTAINFALAFFIIVVLVVAAISDLQSYTIPNLCSIILIGAFPLAVLMNSSFDQIYGNIAVFFAVLLVGYGLFLSNNMGAGDAKLLAAIGLWAGLEQIMLAVFAISLMSLLLVFVLVALRRGLALVRARWPAFGEWCYPQFLQVGEKVPLGVAISLGTLAILPANKFLNLGFSIPSLF